jgi:hypothetical protein
MLLIAGFLADAPMIGSFVTNAIRAVQTQFWKNG